MLSFNNSTLNTKSSIIKIDQNNIDAKHTAQIWELRLRLKAHEDQTDDIKRKLETLIKAVEEIKLLLASNQIK